MRSGRIAGISEPHHRHPNRFLAALALGAVTVGRLTASSPGVGLALAAIPLLAVISIGNAGLVAAAVYPAVFMTYRVGPGALNMSVADLALLCAIPVGVFTVSSNRRSVVALLRVIAIYELVLLIVVVHHPSSLAIIEWMHRLALMGGGILVGAAVVRLASLRSALQMFFFTAAVIALAALATSAAHGFAPAYPLGINKNAAGSMLAMAIAIVATMPIGDSIPAEFYRPLYLLYGAGLAATKSRGAMVGVAVVLGMFFLLHRGGRRFRVLTAASVVAGILFVATSVQHERSTDTFKTASLSVRERQHHEASAVFKAHRTLGAGIRYYDEDVTLAPDGRPSSLVYEVVAESGYVGAVDLVFLLSGLFLVMRRMRSPWGATAMGVLGVAVVHALFDNFWVAGAFTLPWLIIGAAAALALQATDDSPEDIGGVATEPDYAPTPPRSARWVASSHAEPQR